MSERREKATLHLDECVISGRLERVRAATKQFSAILALQAATWEPHDWSDWEA